MTGLSRSSADLDPRRKRLLFRAWHRGTREMDLLMGRYAESVVDTLDEANLAAFEAMIDLSDHDLFAWLTGAIPVPAEQDTPLFRAFRQFHDHLKPLDL
ncbi:MAG: succinate dehydrogenase assembly factor 2 [Proteobacteria bacterium]|nr:succinate dehydrogenase assembly factor 2 [Pseudomonadota bacterium]